MAYQYRIPKMVSQFDLMKEDFYGCSGDNYSQFLGLFENPQKKAERLKRRKQRRELRVEKKTAKIETMKGDTDFSKKLGDSLSQTPTPDTGGGMSTGMIIGLSVIGIVAVVGIGYAVVKMNKAKAPMVAPKMKVA